MKRARSAATGQDGNELDSRMWQLLCEMTCAASRGDRNAARSASDQFGREYPDRRDYQRIALYLWFLLHMRVKELVGHEPAEDDLRSLAASIEDRFARVGRTDDDLVHRALRTYFELARSDEEVAGGLLIISGTAALGALLDDPSAQLAAMRPGLATWWQTNPDMIIDT